MNNWQSQKRCQCCHKTFWGKRSDAKYCSSACKQRMYRAGVKADDLWADRKPSVTDTGAANRNASILIGVHLGSETTKGGAR